MQSTEKGEKMSMRYSILLLLVVFFVLLQYSIYVKNPSLLNIALVIYLPLWVGCVTFELIGDISSMFKKDSHKDYGDGYYFSKYLLFIVHSILLYGLITKTVNVVRPDTPFSLLLILPFFPLFYPIFVIYDLFKRFYKHNNKIKDNLIHIYWLIALVSVFNIYEIVGTGLGIDKLVYQDREKIINHYQELCSKQNSYIKEYYVRQDKNNMFSQKYRVTASYHSDSEKCVSISNTYFDPNLSMRKCGNEEIIIDTAKWLKYTDN